MQISEQVIEVLNYICEKIGITIDWTSANIVPYLSMLCEKYIRYEIATSAVWLFVGIIGIIVSVVFIRKAAAKLKESEYDDIWIIYIAICVIAMLIFILIFLQQIFDIIECCTIPEKVILEYVQSLLKKTGT